MTHMSHDRTMSGDRPAAVVSGIASITAAPIDVALRIAGNVRILTHRHLLGDLLSATLSARPVGDGPIAVTLIDGDLPTGNDTVGQLVADARDRSQAVAVVFCPSTPHAAARWIELGVNAVIMPDATADELRRAVDRLSHGEEVLGIAVREGLLAQLRSHRRDRAGRDQGYQLLTTRERDVLHRLAMGTSPEDIARTSFVSMNTVRSHIKNVLTKLGVGSVAAAVSLAHRSNWFDHTADA